MLNEKVITGHRIEMSCESTHRMRVISKRKSNILVLLFLELRRLHVLVPATIPILFLSNDAINQGGTQSCCSNLCTFRPHPRALLILVSERSLCAGREGIASTSL